jgi:hypothetical protein
MAIDPLASVHDRLAIQDVLNGYCRGIDRMDEALIAAAYWPDANEDHGIFKGRAKEFVPWIVKYLEQTYRATAHRLAQSSVQLFGDSARAETYFCAFHHLRSDDGANFEAVDGRYIDEFQKRGQVWRISSRVVVLDFARKFPVSGSDVAKLPGLTFGQRGKSDFSYFVLSDGREKACT